MAAKYNMWQADFVAALPPLGALALDQNSLLFFVSTEVWVRMTTKSAVVAAHISTHFLYFYFSQHQNLVGLAYSDPATFGGKLVSILLLLLALGMRHGYFRRK
jgi:hypothetical protein